MGQKQTVDQARPIRPIRSQHCSGHWVLNVLEYFTHVLCSSNQLAGARGLISIKHSFRPLTYKGPDNQHSLCKPRSVSSVDALV